MNEKDLKMKYLVLKIEDINNKLSILEKENFWKIIPGEYKKALARMEKEAAVKKALDNEIVLDEVHNG